MRRYRQTYNCGCFVNKSFPLKEAKKLAEYTERVTQTRIWWRKSDQEILEGLVKEVEEWRTKFHDRCEIELDSFRKHGIQEGVDKVIDYVGNVLFDEQTAYKIDKHFN